MYVLNSKRTNSIIIHFKWILQRSCSNFLANSLDLGSLFKCLFLCWIWFQLHYFEIEYSSLYVCYIPAKRKKNIYILIKCEMIMFKYFFFEKAKKLCALLHENTMWIANAEWEWSSETKSERVVRRKWNEKKKHNEIAF